jgi:crotonobetainyl-CoA:carnitine CoA-transferase CaiB-like acyl-CoA transferase
MNTARLRAPLHDIKVIDFTRHMAGLYATVFLADYGADEVKIEPLPDGDASRMTGELVGGKVSSAYLMWNSGKRSVALDMRNSESLPMIHRLVKGGLGRHPPLGEHAREILLEAGFDSADVDRLIATKTAAEPRELS